MKARAANLLPWAGIVAGAEILLGGLYGWIQYLRAPSLRLGTGYPDFLGFYATARIAATYGASHIYDLALQQSVQRQITGDKSLGFFPPASPPYFYLALRPLALLDLRTAYIVWSSATAVSLAVAVALLVRSTGLRGRHAWALGLLAAAWLPVLVAVLQAQAAGVVLLGVAGAVALWTRGRPAAAGVAALLALARPQLIPLLPVQLAVRRAWPALAALAAGAAVLATGSVPLIGWQAVQSYLKLLGAGALQGNLRFANAEQATYGIRGLVDLLHTGPLDAALPLLLLAAGALAIAIRPNRPMLDAALAVTVSADAALHSNLHDFTLLLAGLLPAAGLLLGGGMRFPKLGWAAVAGSYLLVDGALLSPLVGALGVQVLVAYLLLERLAARA